MPTTARPKLPPPWFIALLLGALVVANWRLANYFVWRDEWVHAFVHWWGNLPEYWIAPHFGHFKPLFKGVFWLEMRLFGSFSAGYHYVMLAGWTAVCWVAWRLYRDVLQQEHLALLAALLLVFHAHNFSNLLWAHQICVVLHVLFQALYLWELWRQVNGQADRYSLARALLWLVLQNYLFSNGILLPLLGVAVYGLYGGWRGLWRRPAVGLHLALTGLFVFTQALSLYLYPLHSMGQEGWAQKLLTSIPLTLLKYAELLGRLTWRFFFLEGQFLGGAEAVLGLLVLAGLVGVGWLLHRQRLRPLLFALGWLLYNVVLLAVGRYMLGGMPNRYNTLVVLPLTLLLALVVQGLMQQKPRLFQRLRPVLLAGFVLVLGVFFVLNQYITHQYSRRFALSRLHMEMALKTTGAYQPYYVPADFLPENVKPRTYPLYRKYQCQTFLHLRHTGLLSPLERRLPPDSAPGVFPPPPLQPGNARTTGAPTPPSRHPSRTFCTETAFAAQLAA